MFAKTTTLSILALVDADPTATDTERERIRRACLMGDGAEVSAVLTFAEAAHRLGARNPQFARNLAHDGRLKSVYGSGSRPMGVTAASVEAFLAAGGCIDRNHYDNSPAPSSAPRRPLRPSARPRMGNRAKPAVPGDTTLTPSNCSYSNLNV